MDYAPGIVEPDAIMGTEKDPIEGMNTAKGWRTIHAPHKSRFLRRLQKQERNLEL
jgi:hypothetical protein